MIRDSICGSCGLWHSINCDDDGKNTWGLCPNTKDAETQEYGPLRRGESAQEKHQNARKNHEERLREWVTAQQKCDECGRILPGQMHGACFWCGAPKERCWSTQPGCVLLEAIARATVADDGGCAKCGGGK
jgi:hypothetical protein